MSNLCYRPQPVRVHGVILDQTDGFVYVGKADVEQHELGEEKELALFFLVRLLRKVMEDKQGKIIETAG